MMDYDCSVLVLSYDKNISLLNIFFDCFHKHWSDCPFPVYLGIETIKPEYENVCILNSSEAKWGERVLGYLASIKANYVLLFLDDFVSEQTVETKQIIKYLNYMKENKNIVTISLANIYDNDNIASDYESLCKRRPDADYLLNLQVGIWNKETLIQLMRKEENPWQTELFGSIRARKLKNKSFLCLKSDTIAPYKYGRGWLMVRGVWNGNEIQRLGLQKYAKDIFDGRDIIYSDLMHINFLTRIKRRIQIEYRKILSRFKIYM